MQCGSLCERGATIAGARQCLLQLSSGTRIVATVRVRAAQTVEQFGFHRRIVQLTTTGEGGLIACDRLGNATTLHERYSQPELCLDSIVRCAGSVEVRQRLPQRRSGASEVTLHTEAFPHMAAYD